MYNDCDRNRSYSQSSSRCAMRNSWLASRGSLLYASDFSTGPLLPYSRRVSVAHSEWLTKIENCHDEGRRFYLRVCWISLANCLALCTARRVDVTCFLTQIYITRQKFMAPYTHAVLPLCACFYWNISRYMLTRRVFIFRHYSKYCCNFKNYDLNVYEKKLFWFMYFTEIALLWSTRNRVSYTCAIVLRF